MRKELLTKCGFAGALCLLMGFLAYNAAHSSSDTWYRELTKPGYYPPDKIFLYIWMFCYVLTGIAAGIIWDAGFHHKWVKTALYHFIFQLLLSAFWPIVYFGLHQLILGILCLAALFILLLITIKWFRIINRSAAYMLYPYAGWILFILVMQVEIGRLNYW